MSALQAAEGPVRAKCPASELARTQTGLPPFEIFPHPYLTSNPFLPWLQPCSSILRGAFTPPGERPQHPNRAPRAGEVAPATAGLLLEEVDGVMGPGPGSSSPTQCWAEGLQGARTLLSCVLSQWGPLVSTALPISWCSQKGDPLPWSDTLLLEAWAPGSFTAPITSWGEWDSRPRPTDCAPLLSPTRGAVAGGLPRDRFVPLLSTSEWATKCAGLSSAARPASHPAGTTCSVTLAIPVSQRAFFLLP